jgi:hypothetical protein
LPRINVTVPASVLLGLSETGAHLDGYGPIPADIARTVATDAEWRRILTDPATGCATDLGTTTYTPPASLARFVETRDRTCRFPGCTIAAERTDLDHTVPYPHGPTAAGNLGALCRRHHRMKHEADGVHVQQDGHGRFAWTLPTGRRMTVEPPHLDDRDRGHPDQPPDAAEPPPLE